MNKQFRRVISFLLALVLLVALPLDISAQAAVAVPWLTWIIISYMAACGITFTATGGINALESAVEEAWDDFQSTQTEIIDISDYITFYTPPTGNGPPDPVESALQIGYVGAALLIKFVEWLIQNGWSAGSEVNTSMTYYYRNMFVAQGDSVAATYIAPSGYYNSIFYPIICAEDTGSGNILFTNCIADCYFLKGQQFYLQTFPASSSYRYVVLDNWDVSLRYSTTDNVKMDASEITAEYGYTENDIIGVIMGTKGTSSSPNRQFGILGYYLNDGNIILCSSAWSNPGTGNNWKTGQYTSSIEIPQELEEFPLSEGQALLINFSEIFGNAQPQNIEEAADAIKQNIVDTGTLPAPSAEVYTPPEPSPSPVPTPESSTDGSLEGNVIDILSWLKAILNSLLSLPQTLANLLLDGIKAIFVPDPDDMNAQFMELLEEINDKYMFDFDLDSLFSSSKEPDDITAVYTVGPLSWNVTFVSWYYLKKGVEFFRPFIRGFIVLMLIFYNLRQFMAIFGLGGVMNGASADKRVEDLAV